MLYPKNTSLRKYWIRSNYSMPFTHLLMTEQATKVSSKCLNKQKVVLASTKWSPLLMKKKSCQWPQARSFKMLHQHRTKRISLWWWINYHQVLLSHFYSKKKAQIYRKKKEVLQNRRLRSSYRMKNICITVSISGRWALKRTILWAPKVWLKIELYY